MGRAGSVSKYRWDLNDAQWLAVHWLYPWNLSHELFTRKDMSRGHTSVTATFSRNSNQPEFKQQVSGQNFDPWRSLFWCTRWDLSVGHITATFLWNLSPLVCVLTLMAQKVLSLDINNVCATRDNWNTLQRPADTCRTKSKQQTPKNNILKLYCWHSTCFFSLNLMFARCFLEVVTWIWFWEYQGFLVDRQKHGRISIFLRRVLLETRSTASQNFGSGSKPGTSILCSTFWYWFEAF